MADTYRSFLASRCHLHGTPINPQLHGLENPNRELVGIVMVSEL
jgi:hypothetical protein